MLNTNQSLAKQRQHQHQHQQQQQQQQQQPRVTTGFSMNMQHDGAFEQNQYNNRNNYWNDRQYDNNRNNYNDYGNNRQYNNNNRRNNNYYNNNYHRSNNSNNNYNNNNNNRYRNGNGARKQSTGEKSRSVSGERKELRDSTTVPNLPQQFDIDIDTDLPTSPFNPSSSSNGLHFVTQTVRKPSVHDNTQPFDVMDVNEQQQQQDQRQEHRKNGATTAKHRRRQRRVQQKQRNENNPIDDNRLLSSGNHSENEENEEQKSIRNSDLNVANANENKSKNEQPKKNKQPVYLETARILKYMQDKASPAVGGRSNQAYILATTSIYDEWVRNNYDLQIWQIYLKLGTEHKHWAKDIVKRTKKRDDVINTRFVKKKINQLTTKIAEASAAIADFQVQLGAYWTQSLTGSTTLTTSTGAVARTREGIDRIERIILQYILLCTQHVKKTSEEKIRLAKLEMEEYIQLEQFRKTANPSQWNLHLILKSKTKTWYTKQKNYETAVKRMEYDLPPKFILKNDLTLNIDETLVDKNECQVIYDETRELVKNFRLQAMSLYVKALKHEVDSVTNAIQCILEGFPEQDNNDDNVFGSEAQPAQSAQPASATFQLYHDLHQERLNLEIQQSLYFLELQKSEFEPPDYSQEEEQILAPTITRSLGEDFVLQA